MTPRAIVLIDGLFEGALGVVLLVGVAAGWLGEGDFPAPVGTRLVAAIGCVLLALGGYLFLLQRRQVAAALLRALAIGNLVTACAAVAWRAAASGFSETGSALSLATAAGLVALAAIQLWLSALRPRRPAAV